MNAASGERRLLALTRAWAFARRRRLDAKRAMDAHRCALQTGDGDSGRARCFHLTTVTADWCEPCRTRQPLFHAMLARRRVEKAALLRLRALVDRRSFDS